MKRALPRLCTRIVALLAMYDMLKCPMVLEVAFGLRVPKREGADTATILKLRRLARCPMGSAHRSVAISPQMNFGEAIS